MVINLSNFFRISFEKNQVNQNPTLMCINQLETELNTKELDSSRTATKKKKKVRPTLTADGQTRVI